MSINLQKGQKGGTGLKHIMVGLGWDEAQQSSSGGGFLGLFKSKPADIDCDASAILCNSDGKYIDLVYYRNLQTSNGSIVHQGDKVSPSVGKIVFVVNIYSASDRKQHFGMIQNAFIRLVDMDKNNEICRYNLSDNYYGMEGLIVGEIYRYNGEWKFNAIGQPVQSASHVDKLTAMYK